MEQQTWIPTKSDPKPVEQIMELGKDKAWVPPLMAGLATSFCSAIILSLLRPPLVVYKTSNDKPEHAPRLQSTALFFWSLLAGICASIVLQNM